MGRMELDFLLKLPSMNVSMSLGGRQRLSFSTMEAIRARYPLFQLPLQTGHGHVRHRLSQSAASSLEPEVRASGVKNPF